MLDPMEPRPDDLDAPRPSTSAPGLAFAQAANEAAATVARAMNVDHPVDAVERPAADRPALTRVPVAAEERPREPTIDWCRHEVRRIVAWHLVGTSLAVLGVVVPWCWWRYDSAAMAVGIGVAAAAVVVAIRIGVVLVAGPLGFRFVKTFTASPPEYLLAHRPVVASLPAPESDGPRTPIDLWDLDPNQEIPSASDAPATEPVDDGTEVLSADPHPERRLAIADVLREMGFSHAATVHADGRARAVVDLFTDGDLIVVAAERSSGTVTVLTELAGFRVLVSSTLLVPPTDELVVNVVDHADPAGLVLSHQRLVQQAFRSRTLAIDPVGLFKLAQQRELEAYRELGPFWGAMLDLRCRHRIARLAASPTAGDVLLFTGNRLFQHTS